MIKQTKNYSFEELFALIVRILKEKRLGNDVFDAKNIGKEINYKMTSRIWNDLHISPDDRFELLFYLEQQTGFIIPAKTIAGETLNDLVTALYELQLKTESEMDELFFPIYSKEELTKYVFDIIKAYVTSSIAVLDSSTVPHRPIDVLFADIGLESTLKQRPVFNKRTFLETFKPTLETRFDTLKKYVTLTQRDVLTELSFLLILPIQKLYVLNHLTYIEENVATVNDFVEFIWDFQQSLKKEYLG